MAADPNANPPVQAAAASEAAGATFQITRAKLYVAVVIYRQMVTSNS